MLILAALRKMFAKSSSVDALASVVEDITKKYILPSVEEMASQDPSYEESIDAWEKTLDKSNLLTMGKMAYSAIRKAGLSMGLGESDIENMVQNLIEEIYRRKTWEKLPDGVLEQAGTQWLRYFMGMSRRSAIGTSRTLFRKRKHEVHQAPMEDGEDPLDNLSETQAVQVSLKEEKEIVRDIHRYVSPKLNDKEEEIFKLWFEEISKGGKVNLLRDVVAPLLEGGVAKTSVYNAVKKIRKLVAKYFRSEYDMEIPKGVFASDKSRLARRKSIAAYVLPRKGLLMDILCR